MQKITLNRKLKILLITIIAFCALFISLYYIILDIIPNSSYTSQQQGYSFSHPSFWTVKDNNQNRIVIDKLGTKHDASEYALQGVGAYITILKTQTSFNSLDELVAANYITDYTEGQIAGYNSISYTNDLGNEEHVFFDSFSNAYSISLESNKAGNTGAALSTVLNTFSVNDAVQAQLKSELNPVQQVESSEQVDNLQIVLSDDKSPASLPFTYSYDFDNVWYSIDGESIDALVSEGATQVDIPKTEQDEIQRGVAIVVRTFKLGEDQSIKSLTEDLAEEKFEVTYLIREGFQASEFRRGNNAYVYVQDGEDVYSIVFYAANQDNFILYHSDYRKLINSITAR